MPPGGKHRPCNRPPWRQNIQDKNVKLYVETMGFFPLHGVKPWALFSRKQPLRLSPISHKCVIAVTRTSRVRSEDESRRVFEPVLTALSVLWSRHKVAVESGELAVALRLSLVYLFLTSMFSRRDLCTSYTDVLFLIFFFFKAPLAPVKWLWFGLMLTFPTVSVSPWALVTAGYFHLCQVPTIFTSSSPRWPTGCLLPDLFAWPFGFQKTLASDQNQQSWQRQLLCCAALSNTSILFSWPSPPGFQQSWRWVSWCNMGLYDGIVKYPYVCCVNLLANKLGSCTLGFFFSLAV